jgi:hypothetical protein
MSRCVDTNRQGGYWWRCRRTTFPYTCSASTSIKPGSWFQLSKLNLMKVLFLAYSVHLYEQDREHVEACEVLIYSQQPNQGIIYPATCLRWSADPTRPSSPRLLASLQPWTGASHLPIIVVMSLCNSPSPHTTLHSNHRPQHVSKWRVHHHGWRGTFIRGAVRVPTLLKLRTTAQHLKGVLQKFVWSVSSTAI